MSYKYDNYYVNKTFCKEDRKLKRNHEFIDQVFIFADYLSPVYALLLDILLFVDLL